MLERSSYKILFVAQGVFVTNFVRTSKMAREVAWIKDFVVRKIFGFLVNGAVGSG